MFFNIFKKHFQICRMYNLYNMVRSHVQCTYRPTCGGTCMEMYVLLVHVGNWQNLWKPDTWEYRTIGLVPWPSGILKFHCTCISFEMYWQQINNEEFTKLRWLYFLPSSPISIHFECEHEVVIKRYWHVWWTSELLFLLRARKIRDELIMVYGLMNKLIDFEEFYQTRIPCTVLKNEENGPKTFTCKHSNRKWTDDIHYNIFAVLQKQYWVWKNLRAFITIRILIISRDMVIMSHTAHIIDIVF